MSLQMNSDWWNGTVGNPGTGVGGFNLNGVGAFNEQQPFGLPSSTGGGAGSGMNWQTGLGMGLQGLNTLGNIWGAWQSNKLAKDQLNFTKMITNANLNNQIKSYNTALEDRSRSRAAVEGQSSAEAQAYVDKNRLTRG